MKGRLTPTPARSDSTAASAGASSHSPFFVQHRAQANCVTHSRLARHSPSCALRQLVATSRSFLNASSTGKDAMSAGISNTSGNEPQFARSSERPPRSSIIAQSFHAAAAAALEAATERPALQAAVKQQGALHTPPSADPVLLCTTITLDASASVGQAVAALQVRFIAHSPLPVLQSKLSM